jgi:hypothetical protein
MKTTSVCRMQAYACKELGTPILYLSPMHISQRAINGRGIPDTHPKLVNLEGMQRAEVHAKLIGEIKYRKGQYIL